MKTKLLPALSAGTVCGAFLALISLLPRLGFPNVLFPSLGASMALLIVLPTSPLCRVQNVLGGHLICAAAGIALVQLLGYQPWVACLAVGIALTLMLLTDTLHIPACGNPLVILVIQANWYFIGLLFLGVLAVLLLGKAYLYVRPKLYAGQA